MKRHILTFIALALALTRVQADGISVPDVTIVPGTAAQVGISLDNTETNLVSFQMDLTLPEGISINKNECSLSSRFTDEDQELTIGKQGDNVYRLTSTSFAMTPLSGTSGEIITLSLSASESATGGTATLSNIRFVTSNSERVTLDDVSFSISVSSGVEDDGAILIMGQPWEARYQFVENWENATDPMDGDTPWYSPDFDDSGWPTLTGPLDTSNWEAEGSAYYLRRVFTMSEVKDCSFFLTVNHDDYVKVYLNGTLVGEEDFTGNPSDFSIPSGLLAEGENLLAIYIDDRGGGGRLLDYEFHHIFIAQTAEGVDMTFKVISESEKTCMVETGGIIETYNGEITIPSVVNGYTVTRIGKWAFSCRGGLTSVTIPETVESIGTQAFNFTGLTAITLPSNLKTIEDGVFQGCTGITSVTIPASVTSIAGGSFDATNLASIEVESGNQVYDSRNDCNAIIETATNTLIAGCPATTIPDGIETIGIHAFVNCYGLESITIPSSVKSIGHRAFYHTGLTSITIPSGVEYFNGNAITGCTELTSIVVESGNTVYDCRDNCNAIIESSTNTLIAGCKNTIIPNTVTRIGSEAFYDHGEISSIEIPSSVTSIGDQAFRGSGLTSINIPEGVTSIDFWAFAECGNLTSVTVNNPVPISLSEDLGIDRANATLYVPAGSLDAYANADYWRDFKRIVEEGDAIQLMGQPWEARYQFVENWENATDPMDGDTPWYSPDFNDSAWLTLTGPLDGNNWNAEYSAYYLRRTFTLNEVKDGYYLIHANHDDHVKVYLNGTLVGVKEGSGTHDLFIPSSLLQVGENILAIYIDDNGGVDRCLDYDFRYIGDGTGPDIYVDEQGVVYQREDNNYSVSGYVGEPTSIVIPGELFDLPVTSIGASAFADSGSLVSVSIPESVTSIGHSAFIRCTSLSAVNIPDGVTFIDDWAFQCCALSSITIPASVTGIGVGAFNQCPLTVVTTNMAVPCEIAAETFTNRANAVLFVPAGCKADYEEADYWKEFKLIVDVSEDILLSGGILPWEMKYVFRESCEDLQEPEADSNENPWYAAEYDDSAWETLTGPMARDAERFSQVNYSWETPGSCYFLRRKFQMDAVREGFYEIHGICDDNMDVYLNGHKIFKTEFEGFNWSFRVPSLFLHEGENTLAIFAADDGGGDAYLDYSMHFLQEDEIIEFADPDVEEICCNSYWFDSNGDGHLSKVEAASVESLMDSFMAHEESVLETFDSFDELQYFTGLTELNAWVFLNCRNLSSIIIPESVKSILFRAFENCSSLTSITIPESVTNIESDAFLGCSGLTSVTFLGNALGDRQHFVNIFSGCPDDILFNIPEGTAGSYLRRGFKNLSDKSGLPLVREVFEAEATHISAMAEEVSDGDKTALASAIEESRDVVTNTDDYMAVYAQIAAVKSAAKTFLTTATLPQDFDVTAATITNPDFDLLDIGWKVDNIAENIGRLDEEGINHWENGDVVMDNFIEAYQTGRALGDGNISQTITNLPAGTYRFEADIIASNEYDASAEVTGVCLFAGENMSSSVSTEFRKPQHISFTFENPTTCDVTVGINITGTNANWVAADNFRLYYVVQEEVEVTDISQLDNVIYIEPFVENKGNRDDISIKMKNSAEIRGFQFELVLPEGITPVEEDDVILCGLNPDRSPKNSLGTLYHTIEAKRQDDGSYVVLCGSQQDKTFLGNDGEIAKLYVNVSPDMATGDYPIILRNIKLSETDISHFYQVEEVVTKLTIVDIIGDINGDKTVDVSDYIGVANHILGNTPSGFNYNAADVNRDGAIDVSDYIGIANIILTGSIYGNRNATTRSLNNNEEVRNPQ